MTSFGMAARSSAGWDHGPQHTAIGKDSNRFKPPPARFDGRNGEHSRSPQRKCDISKLRCSRSNARGTPLFHRKISTYRQEESSSANKWVEKRKHTSVDACFDTLRAEGFRILATRLGSGTNSLYDLDLTGQTAFVLGNEHRGISDEAAEKADECVHIPMMGMIESLNVSVAAAVCLYESFRQRLGVGMMNVPQLPQDVLDALTSSWTTL